MTAWLRRLLTRPCDIHDRAWPAKIAELEVATGIDPSAMERFRQQAPLTVSFCDPDLIDCRSRRCRQRRGLP